LEEGTLNPSYFILSAGYDAAVLRASAFTATDVKNAGYSAQQMANSSTKGYGVEKVWFSVDELRAAGFDDNSLTVVDFAKTHTIKKSIKKEHDDNANNFEGETKIQNKPIPAPKQNIEFYILAVEIPKICLPVEWVPAREGGGSMPRQRVGRCVCVSLTAQVLPLDAHILRLNGPDTGRCKVSSAICTYRVLDHLHPRCSTVTHTDECVT
jgi:hypothetical protein